MLYGKRHLKVESTGVPIFIALCHSKIHCSLIKLDSTLPYLPICARRPSRRTFARVGIPAYHLASLGTTQSVFRCNRGQPYDVFVSRGRDPNVSPDKLRIALRPAIV